MIVIGIKSTDVNKINESIDSFSKDVSFKLIDHLTFNSGWTAISVDAEMLDEDLVKHISRETGTVAIAYEEVDIVGVYKVITYINGNLEDELSVVDFSVDEKTGFFQDVPDEFEDQSEISDIFNKYFGEIGFEPLASEILDNL